MLKVRNLEESDLKSLSDFIIEIYKEYPNAMWFDSEPTKEMLSRLFSLKLAGMQESNVIDMVAVEDSKSHVSILGEVEVARVAGPAGYIGIIIGKGHRRKGLGAMLMGKAYNEAIALGITELKAEVAKENIPAQHFFIKEQFKLFKVDDAELNKKTNKKKMLLFEKSLR